MAPGPRGSFEKTHEKISFIFEEIKPTSCEGQFFFLFFWWAFSG